MQRILDLTATCAEALIAVVLLASIAVAQSPLTTTFAGGNGSNGNMFDVKAISGGVVVNDFDVHFTGTGDFEIWALNTPGTYVGNQTSNANWTLLATVQGVVSAGANLPTPLGQNLNFTILPGQTQGFYIHRLNGILAYTNGTGTTAGTLFASNADLEIFEGHGGGYFGVTIQPRVWNGNIHYLPLSTATDDMAVFNVVAPVNDTVDCSPRSATETVTVDLINFGMNPIAVGTILTLGLQVDANPTVFEFFNVTTPITTGQQVQYTFTATADLSSLGNHSVTVSVLYGLDLVPANDAITEQIGSGGALRVTNYPFTEDFTHTGTQGLTTLPIGFVQETTDATGPNSDWAIRNDSTPTPGAGPNADHTTGTSGTGGYIYAEDDGNFATVNLRSPCFDMGGLINPSLRFFMYSNNSTGTAVSNTLSVDVITYPGATVTMDVFGPTGQTGNSWMMQAVDLSAFAGQEIQVVFRADTSLVGNTHDIAIDDISLTDLQPTPGQAPQFGSAVLNLNDPRNPNGDALQFGFGGPYFTSVTEGDTLLFRMEGEALQPIILFAGALNPGAATFPAIGGMDVGGPVDPITGIPTAVVILADGTQAQLGGLNPFLVTAANGICDMGYTVPNLPLGVLTTFQCAFLTTSGSGIALSNAVQLTIM